MQPKKKGHLINFKIHIKQFTENPQREMRAKHDSGKDMLSSSF